MRVRYSEQALADIDAIAGYYGRVASPEIAGVVEARLRLAIRRISLAPDIAPKLVDRDFWAAAVPGLPYRIFYRSHGMELQVIHIRHTSRRPF
ncbi:type II toxin-antitoxin system RelE/ParE family toxin [Bradyrhizobium sediminis]|uniref:Type II toxin-antitoxin system RelE/ParE family toxin n=1 Tax=Bradyrhizobium sediminis TaxID=2840469 RepID=A0A975NFQ3_9BRAD|nr:type II toxin-antitoxin system RelE/ParE family toxin [Bradyrhizobium sediminis]